ncbi:DUF916 and DUF3324 domain-containing protein [Enterococcus faecalis]|uniref:DUF916 and DUF3324 domain-containing protein n=3 Tax=Enterococcus faecalis TaxID=1351 RepID=UPI00032E3720|nr:DUF916 and DUF3324 domain-containing protein [Enterococcus faecalis]EOJ71577.1 hypothetical protein WMY_01950 [Enterococcus faecalis EnGen0337]MDL4974201.1 DUF916 and DUF3324 domain-containing protein [Enterococcus faecalis]
MKKVRVYFLALLIVLGITMVPTVEAAEMNFSVQAVIPENQQDKSKTYFDLKMTPNQSQDITITMKNDTSKDVTVEVGVNTATTNDNGIADYNGKKEKDSTLKYDLSDLIEIDKEIVVPSNGETSVVAHLKMPKEMFDGVLVGGFTFIEKESTESLEEQKGVSVVNKYAYTIGIQLQETDKIINPELVLNDVSPTQVNFRNVVEANIQNTESAILKDLTIDGKIFKKNGKEALYETKRTDLRMAPNSNFNYRVSLNNDEFKPGVYVFKGVANAGDKEWKFEKEFTIKGDVAKALNEKAVEIDKDYTIYIYIGVGLIIFILVLIILYLLRKVKRAQ